MKNVFLLLAYLLLSVAVAGQKANLTTTRIRQEMAGIRQNTNWNDPVAAKSANARIQELSKQLLMTGNQNTQTQNTDNNEYSDENEELVKMKTDITTQILKAVATGEGDAFLAKPLREEIVEEYKDEESPIVKSQLFFDEITYLVIDMSLPTIRRTIDQMRSYKSIKPLIITGGRDGTPVNLSDLLLRASAYPLERLYIINFKQYVNSLPQQISKFKKLSILALYNNNISKLPDLSEIRSSLDTLYVDLNPISTLYPALGSLTDLKKLGIVKTAVSEAEIEKIKQQLPKCQIIK
jgi:hypothetical protein